MHSTLTQKHSFITNLLTEIRNKNHSLSLPKYKPNKHFPISNTHSKIYLNIHLILIKIINTQLKKKNLPTTTNTLYANPTNTNLLFYKHPLLIMKKIT